MEDGGAQELRGRTLLHCQRINEEISVTGLEPSRGRMVGKEAAVEAELEAWRLELGLHLLLGMVLGATAALEWSVMSSGARRCP